MGSDTLLVQLNDEHQGKVVDACRAPRLTGRTLQFAVWLLESIFSGPIWFKSMRDSGIPQAVRDIHLPEAATFQPYWPQPSSSSSKDESVVEDKPVEAALALASQGIPGGCSPCYADVQHINDIPLSSRMAPLEADTFRHVLSLMHIQTGEVLHRLQ